MSGTVEIAQLLLDISRNNPPMERASYVYILASQRYGTLYVGVTADLLRRVAQHREGTVDGFTKEYGVKRLVWYETHSDIVSAIAREKRVKKWNRAWKIELIQQRNPHWNDLFDELTGLQAQYGFPRARG